MTPGLPAPPDDLAERAVEAVREQTSLVPTIAMILGSGLGPSLAGTMDTAASIAYADLPGFPATSVPGHEGTLALGVLSGVPAAVFFGRFHLYEGHAVDVPALLPRLGQALGASTIVLTGAVGGLLPGLAAGTIVVLEDHLNMMGTTPLRGWRDPEGAPAFVPMAGAYDPALRALALERAGALGIPAIPGVYAAMAGPAYETPAEIRFLRQAGATVVGMSVVPEAVPARALGMRVLGLATVTNALGEDVSHDEVIRVSNETAAALGRLLVDLAPRMEGA